MTNPKVKKGDKIILVESRNTPNLKNTVLEVVDMGGNNIPYVKTPTNPNHLMYTNDIFILATREAEADYLEEKNKSLSEKLKANSLRIDLLRNFKTEEDYVAFKLDKILTAHKSNGTQTDRVQAIKEVLTMLSASSLI